MDQKDDLTKEYQSSLRANLDGGLLENLLDIYCELTDKKISIAFYTDPNEQPIYPPNNWPKFCQMASNIIGQKTCNLDSSRLKTEGLYQCQAGLWCYAYPLIIDNILIGTFVVGHRLLEGKVEESVNVLNETLKKSNISEEKSNMLLDLLNKEKPIKSKTLDGFDIELLKKLSFIEAYVTQEHQRSSMDKDKRIGFKNEAVSLAHEFLLPIQSIVADAENLMAEAFDVENPEIKSLAEDILEEIIKLSYIAETIRGSVLEERELKLEFELIDVYNIIFDAANLFRKEAKKKDVKLNIKQTNKFRQENEMYIEASETYIKQVFFNLIHNAIKYSFTSTNSSERYVTIVCDSFKNMFVCEISNFGIGILPDEIEQQLIYQKGYRGILSRDRSRTGSGFGLSRVKEIVTAHNGTIEVESRKIGTYNGKIIPHLTTFKIYLPYNQPRK